MQTQSYPIDRPLENQSCSFTESALQSAEECVTEHPEASLLVSAAAGFVVGLAIGACFERPLASRSSSAAAGLADALGNRFLSSIDNLASSSMETIRETLGR